MADCPWLRHTGDVGHRSGFTAVARPVCCLQMQPGLPAVQQSRPAQICFYGLAGTAWPEPLATSF